MFCDRLPDDIGSAAIGEALVVTGTTGADPSVEATAPSLKPTIPNVAAIFGEGSGLSRLLYARVGIAALVSHYTATKMNRRTA